MSTTIEAQIFPLYSDKEAGAATVIQAELVERRQAAPAADQPGFVDRRQGNPANAAGVERRQFGNTHYGLSPAARELAEAIDGYKLQHRRRYVTYEEMLQVITKLGYVKQ